MNFISKRAYIGNNVYLGDNIKLYGDVRIYDNTIIENNVTIGHPSPDEQQQIIINSDDTLDVAYDKVTSCMTVIKSSSIIRSNSVIYSGTSIGHHFDCSHNVVIRENCSLGNNLYASNGCDIRSSVTIGNYCRIGGMLADRTIIGNYTSILGSTAHEFKVGIGGIIEKAPTIKDGVIAGKGSIIIGDIIIRNLCIVGANSVLTENTNEMELYVGAPARLVRKLSEKEISYLYSKVNNG